MIDARVSITQRQLAIEAEGEATLRIALDHGGRHHLVVPDAATASYLADILDNLPNFTVMPGNGGLLGAISVAENLALALRYDSDPQDDEPDRWTNALALTLSSFGLSDERSRRLGQQRPMNLERVERWMAGFVRHMLRPPELLVLDRSFVGLSRRQAEEIIGIEALYHEFHPFRPTLFIDVDSHELPNLPNCVSTIAWESQGVHTD